MGRRFDSKSSGADDVEEGNCAGKKEAAAAVDDDEDDELGRKLAIECWWIGDEAARGLGVPLAEDSFESSSWVDEDEEP